MSNLSEHTTVIVNKTSGVSYALVALITLMTVCNTYLAYVVVTNIT